MRVASLWLGEIDVHTQRARKQETLVSWRAWAEHHLAAETVLEQAEEHWRLNALSQVTKQWHSTAKAWLGMCILYDVWDQAAKRRALCEWVTTVREVKAMEEACEVGRAHWDGGELRMCMRQWYVASECGVREAGAMEKVVRYLVGRERVVWYFKWQEEPRGSYVITDSDWGGTKRDRRSTSGGVWMLGGHCIKKPGVVPRGLMR